MPTRPQTSGGRPEQRPDRRFGTPLRWNLDSGSPAGMTDGSVGTNA